MTSTDAKGPGRTALSDVIDTAHLARYTMGDIGLERELLGLFETQLGDLLDELEAAERGSGAWRLALHTLKGAARAIGAFPIARTAAALEEGPGGSETEALCRRLREQVGEFRKAHALWLASHGGEGEGRRSA